MKKKVLMGIGVVGIAALISCGGGSEPPKTADSGGGAAATPAAGGGGTATPDEANGGTITGKVAFDGTAPTMKTLDMSATPACTKAHPGGAKSEEVVINDNKTVKYAFVWIK